MNNEPTIIRPSDNPRKERVIQPSAHIIEHVETQKQQQATNSAAPVAPHYQPPVQPVEQTFLTASQHLALSSTKLRSSQNDRPVSLRVKSVLVVAILGLLASIYTLVLSFATSASGTPSTIIGVVSLIQFAMSTYLLLGKDHTTAALILKIYLVLQLISLFLSFASPSAFVVNGLVTLFLFYVYNRVKSLSY